MAALYAALLMVDGLSGWSASCYLLSSSRVAQSVKLSLTHQTNTSLYPAHTTGSVNVRFAVQISHSLVHHFETSRVCLRSSAWAQFRAELTLILAFHIFIAVARRV